jgi:hypothetical protein
MAAEQLTGTVRNLLDVAGGRLKQLVGEVGQRSGGGELVTDFRDLAVGRVTAGVATPPAGRWRPRCVTAASAWVSRSSSSGLDEESKPRVWARGLTLGPPSTLDHRPSPSGTVGRDRSPCAAS